MTHPPSKVSELNSLEHSYNRKILSDLLSPVLSSDKLTILENMYAKVSSLHLNFSEFITILLETPVWKKLSIQSPGYSDLCLDFSHVVDHLYKDIEVEPSYHSRKHFIDVCLSTHLLILQNESIKGDDNNAWYLSSDQCWYFLLTAMAHDVGHLGRSNQTPYEQEKLAIQHLEGFLDSKTHKNLSSCKEITKQIILATEPRDRSSLITRVQSGIALSSQDQLGMLMVEADLLASVLPIKGVELGIKLSNEIKSQDEVLANLIKSSAGRLGFLNTVAFLSAQSHLLGLDQILKTAILKIKQE
jgi:hypothetical protein